MVRALFRFLVNVLIAALIIGAGIAHNIRTGVIEVGTEWNPFTPLDLAGPSTFIQDWKIERARADTALCMAAMTRTGATLTAIPDIAASPRCGIEGAVTLAGLSSARLDPLNTRCALALELYLWERDSVRPAVREVFGTELAVLEHFGSYSCRRIAGSRRWSHHARAEAIDIAGFRFADGRHVTLLRGWNGTAKERAFLRRVRDGACQRFGGVLSPDFNAAHADHFHFDFSPWGFCR